MDTTVNNIQDRVALKELFKNGIVPSEQDFANLIDSVLTKRDDHFFGKWQNGAGYQEGDVVLYSDKDGQMGIYAFVSKKQAQALATEQNKDCNCLEDDCCGNKPPGDCCRWQLIHVDSDDNDWQIVQDDNQSIMYAKVFGRIGVGTETPDAFLHLNANTEGIGSQLLFSPLGSDGSARLRLKSGGQDMPIEDSKFVDQTIILNDAATTVEWLTNVPLGYVFKKQTSPGTDKEPSGEMTLLLIGSDQNLYPRIGIGTAYPQAALEVADEANGIQLDVNKPTGPQLILLKKETKGGQTRFVQTVDSQFAKWTTTALNGFLFATTTKDPNVDKSLVSIDLKGNVGIGTATPKAKLDILDEKGKNGRFAFDVESANPMLAIKNLLEGGDEVNLNLSVEYNTAAFSTNAEQGFEFRQNDTKVLSLVTDTNANSSTFSAIIDGFAQTNGLYVRPIQSDSNKIESGLDVLKDLIPQSRKRPGGDNHPQMGFGLQNGRNPKIVKQFPDKSYGISQHNLVALLVRSVQELQDQINALQQEVAELRQGRNEQGTA